MQLSILLLIVLSASGTAYAQLIGGTLGGVITAPSGQFGIAPVPAYGPSTSVIDHNGNVLVFDIQYSYSPPAPGAPTPTLAQILKATTRLTVITPSGTALPPIQYDGALQVIGAGWHAVYAITAAYGQRGGTASAPARRLVAFNLTAGVPLSPLPTLEVPIRADVKLSAASEAGSSDLISFVDPAMNPLVLAPATGSTIPAIQRFARIVKYSGGATFSAGTPIPLP